MADKLVGDADVVAVERWTSADNNMPTTVSNKQLTTVAATQSLDREDPSNAPEEECIPTNIGTPPIIESHESSLTDGDDPQIATNPTSKPANIKDLPYELLSHIFGFLDIPRPSADLHDEPTFQLTNATTADLKATSCVSRRWRQAILPLLFKHARFIVGEPQPKTSIRNLAREIQPFIDFVSRTTLVKYITTFVLVVRDMTITGDDNVPDYNLDTFASFWHLLFGAIDPLELLIVAHPTVLGAFTSCRVNLGDLWHFDSPCHYLRLQRPSPLPSQQAVNDKAIDHSRYPPALEAHQVVPLDTDIRNPVKNIPEDLLKSKSAATSHDDNLENLDGQTAGEPAPSVSDIKEALGADPSDVELESLRAPPQSSALFKIRPWSSILLNEGSFIKVYSTYEFWNRKAPSILSDLVGAEEVPSGSRKALMSSTIREMSYIGIFPTASHFCSLTRHLPRLNSLYVQLVPRNDIMDVPSKMVQVESEDLWMERNSCYALLMRELFNAPPLKNYKYLEVFESGDAADVDAWNMAVEYVKRAKNGWRVARDGVFERYPEDLPPEPEEGAESGDSSSFEGALIKWAWNGITKLPVSAYPLYDNPLGPVG